MIPRPTGAGKPPGPRADPERLEFNDGAAWQTQKPNVNFYTDNDAFFGDQKREQDPLYAAPARARPRGPALRRVRAKPRVALALMSAGRRSAGQRDDQQLGPLPPRVLPQPR